MSHNQIAVIVGSLRRDSFNQKLAQAMTKLAPDDFTFVFLNIGELPLYNQDDDDTPEASVQQFKTSIAAANGLLFFTPEYNRSIPGVLKNALDQASRPYGKSAWAGKPAGLIGVSIGATGTSMAQQHLRNILAYLDVPTMCQPEGFIQKQDGLFDSDGQIGAHSKVFLQQWMTNYALWIKRHNAIN